MATERLSMRHTREILRQKLLLGRSHRQVAASLGVGIGTVGTTVLRAQAAGLDWSQVQALTDEALETRLYGPPIARGTQRPLPDCVYLHTELRKPGVTLRLLHVEYLERHPHGYRYTQFCEIYNRWLARHALTMRQRHRAGEKLFVDYSGKKPWYVDPTSGEIIPVELFTAVLGASNYTYLEATRTQQVADHQGVIVIGATGVGKSFLACALAHQACRKGYRALYWRASRLFHELALNRAAGTYTRVLARLARADVLVLDDWGLAPLQEQERQDLLELLDDRYGTRSTILTSQIAPARWHDYLGGPTVADAICDRILHNAYRIELRGESMRKVQAKAAKGG